MIFGLSKKAATLAAHGIGTGIRALLVRHEAYVYFPLLEKTKFALQQKYTNAAETLNYCRVIAEKYDLHANALMQTEVTCTEWDEDSRRWLVKTDRGDAIKARFVVHSNGPADPAETAGNFRHQQFQRGTFHTSRWDYGYTGGNSDGDLDKLKDKRVAVIGTGATAVQCVPHLGASAAELMCSSARRLH